jgi:hypothetical protein
MHVERGGDARRGHVGTHGKARNAGRRGRTRREKAGSSIKLGEARPVGRHVAEARPVGREEQ